MCSSCYKNNILIGSIWLSYRLHLVPFLDSRQLLAMAPAGYGTNYGKQVHASTDGGSWTLYSLQHTGNIEISKKRFPLFLLITTCQVHCTLQKKGFCVMNTCCVCIALAKQYREAQTERRKRKTVVLFTLYWQIIYLLHMYRHQLKSFCVQGRGRATHINTYYTYTILILINIFVGAFANGCITA